MRAQASSVKRSVKVPSLLNEIDLLFSCLLSQLGDYWVLTTIMLVGFYKTGLAISKNSSTTHSSCVVLAWMHQSAASSSKTNV